MRSFISPNPSAPLDKPSPGSPQPDTDDPLDTVNPADNNGKMAHSVGELDPPPRAAWSTEAGFKQAGVAKGNPTMLRFQLHLIASDYADEAHHNRDELLVKVRELEAKNTSLEAKRDEMTKILEESDDYESENQSAQRGNQATHRGD